MKKKLKEASASANIVEADRFLTVDEAKDAAATAINNAKEELATITHSEALVRTRINLLVSELMGIRVQAAGVAFCMRKYSTMYPKLNDVMYDIYQSVCTILQKPVTLPKRRYCTGVNSCRFRGWFSKWSVKNPSLAKQLIVTGNNDALPRTIARARYIELGSFSWNLLEIAQVSPVDTHSVNALIQTIPQVTTAELEEGLQRYDVTSVHGFVELIAQSLPNIIQALSQAVSERSPIEAQQAMISLRKLVSRSNYNLALLNNEF